MELDVSKRVRDVSDRLGYGRDKRPVLMISLIRLFLRTFDASA